MSCDHIPGDHFVFGIFVDGSDVGREVRSSSIEQGPLGQERLYTSHSVIRSKVNRAIFEKREIRFQRTLLENGLLLRASHVVKDQIQYKTTQVGYNGSGWDRLVETRSSLSEKSGGEPLSLELSGDEVIGFRLVEPLREVALGLNHLQPLILYYEPVLASPVSLSISEPLPGTTEIDGQTIDGVWVEARRQDSTTAEFRAFFDKNGSLWIEEYPKFNEVRKVIPGRLTLSTDTSEILGGLRSEAYLPNPGSATHAKYRLRGSPDRLDSLDLLGIPINHKLIRKAPDILILDVHAGAPDADEPTKLDLAESRYVLPKSPEIRRALLYLRTAGRRGYLPEERRYNATSVIARSSLIRHPKRFWSDPVRVAGLVMHYVSSLLPNKNHTFSMADAITSLNLGAGDCTEHSVLFASLMRAAKIPTRLVSGMHLTPGGMWGYHMWNTYWDGSSWRSIDPSNMLYQPGALHVALGGASSRFDDIRDRLADFMWKTFSGLSFDLIEASNNGEILFLARPRNPDQNIREAALFNAVVLSQRGDHRGAIDLLDEHIPLSSRPLSVKLMRIQLLVLAGEHEKALLEIGKLREETSDYKNTDLLDDFELKCLLKMKRLSRAKELFSLIDTRLKNKPDSTVSRAVLNSDFLFFTGQTREAVNLLQNTLTEYPDEAILLSKFAYYVSKLDIKSDDVLLERALAAAYRSIELTLRSDAESLSSLSLILFRLRRFTEADWILDHALILAPADPTLHELRSSFPSCSSENM